MPRSPQWMDLYQIWFRGFSHGRNQLCGILLQSAHGFQFCEGSKFAISHWRGRSPLTQFWCNRAACDVPCLPVCGLRSNVECVPCLPVCGLRGNVDYVPCLTLCSLRSNTEYIQYLPVFGWRDNADYVPCLPVCGLRGNVEYVSCLPVCGLRGNADYVP